MKTLITGSLKLDEAEKEQFAALGLEITYQQDETEPVAAPEQYELVICYELFNANPIEQFTNLKYIQLTSAGMDHLPLAEIAGRGILLHNARGVYSVPMAEFAIGGLLQIYKKAPQFWQNQKEHKWQRLRGVQELAGRRVCIIGAGSIGCALAKRLQAFDCQVQGVDIVPVDSPYFERICPQEELAAILPSTDIVALSLPLSPDTIQMFNAERFAQLKPGAIFVNVARGVVVDEEALVAALQSGHLQGAVLDVFAHEPLAEDSPLWDMPNVVITPHNSFFAESNREMMFKVVMQNLRNYLQNS